MDRPVPSPAANQLTLRHRSQLAEVSALISRQTQAIGLRADVEHITAWWRRVADEVLALVAAGWRTARTLGEQYVVAHAAAEGIALRPRLAYWNSDRVATSLRVTGPYAHFTALQTREPAAARQVMARSLAGSAQRLALAGARETVERTVRRSSEIVGWRRVTDGDPCAWCAMLASRGAVYKSAASAGDPRAGGTPYHDHDGCTAEPLYEHEDEPPEVAALYQQWLDATTGHSGKAAVNAFRRHWESRTTSG